MVKASNGCGSLEKKSPRRNGWVGSRVIPTISSSRFLIGHGCFKEYFRRMGMSEREVYLYGGGRDTQHIEIGEI